MKKLLAMVLALVMTLSLCTVTNAFADDKDINEDYAEAVETLNGMGVFKGYEDGSFKPNGNITRAEVAAIIYRLYTGDVKDKQAGLYAGYGSFSDMAGATWAAGYVGYCANAGFVKGYGNGKFGPSDPVTGYQALAMILRAVGYGKNGEFEGADWELHVAQIAQQVGALKNVKGVSLKGAASRELVAELLFQVAAYVPTVTYTPALGYNQYTTLNGKTENDTLGKINFDLTKADEDDDEFGRPVYSWTNGKTGSKKVTYSTVYAKPLFTFVEATKNCDIYDESGLKKGTELDVYTNSAKKDDTSYTIADNTKEYGKQGRLTEVYEDRIVNIDTYLAEVTKVVAEKTDSRGHVTKAYVLVDEIHGLEGEFTKKFETDGFEKGDFVLVTVADGEIQSMVKADAKNAVLTGALGNSKVRIEIQEVTDLDKDEVKVNHTADYQPVDKMNLGKTYTFYFDTYGNVIGAEELATNYAVLDTLYTDTVKGVDTAFGDLYFFDGESKTDVTINEVVGDDAGDFEATAKKNDNYYYTVYAYTVDKDGAYTLDDADFYGADTAEYTNGNKYITVDDERLQLSKDSKILLQTKESPKGTFTQYTGFEKLPSFNGDDVQFTIVDGYVDMIYVYAYELTTRTVFLYDVEGYATKWNDGKPYTTFKALELVDDKLEEVEINLYIPDEWDGNGHSIPVVGLYEITMSDEYIWQVTDKYMALGINKISDDGKRILTDDGLWFNLDDAIVAKYEGTFTKGEVDQEWTTKDLTEDSIVYVQIDETKHKTDYTYDALAVYDLFIKVPVYVNGKETKDVEYWLKDFNDVTVDLKEYEMIDEAKMDNDDEVIDLTITYYNGETKIGATLDAKGTKVTHAVISYTGDVTGPVVITTGTQDAYPVAELETISGEDFDSLTQSFSIINENPNELGLQYTIIVDKAPEGDVSAANLIEAIKPFLGTNYQKILGVFNTQGTELFTGNLTPNGSVPCQGFLGSDFIVRVQAWDGKTEQVYRVVFGETAVA